MKSTPMVMAHLRNTPNEILNRILPHNRPEQNDKRCETNQILNVTHHYSLARHAVPFACKKKESKTRNNNSNNSRVNYQRCDYSMHKNIQVGRISKKPQCGICVHDDEAHQHEIFRVIKKKKKN